MIYLPVDLHGPLWKVKDRLFCATHTQPFFILFVIQKYLLFIEYSNVYTFIYILVVHRSLSVNFPSLYFIFIKPTINSGFNK